MRKQYLKRFTVCALGLILCGFASGLGAMAGQTGSNAWNTLSLGLCSRMDLSFGMANFAVSLVIILIDLAGKGKLGFGTVMNVVLIAVFSDVSLVVLDFLPEANNVALGVLYALAGQTLLSFASLMYMAPGLGCGPRDTLMVLIGKQFPKAPIGAVRFGIEALAMVCGLLLGAPFGLGTVLAMALQSAIFQLACRVTKIEPRNIVHEDFVETIRKLKK